MKNAHLICTMVILLTLAFAVSVYPLEVLELGGNTEGANWDLQALQQFPEVAGVEINYTTTKDRTLAELDIESFDVLWIGQGEIQENTYFFNEDTENGIKAFVEAGGIMVTANQDSDGGNPCGVAWLPVPITGVEASDHSCTPTADAGDLFTVPNEINPDSLNLDDTWTQPDEDFVVLATSGANTPFVMLRHGNGFYLLTDMETHNAGEVTANAPMHENILHFIIKWREEHLLSVELLGRMIAPWGKIRSEKGL